LYDEIISAATFPELASTCKTPTQASISTSHLKTAGIIEKRLPAPHTTRAGWADRDGHFGKVKGKGGGGSGLNQKKRDKKIS
jgi:hypothetical protein